MTETKVKINLNEIEVGDIFSEESHYTYQGKDKGSMQFLHHGSGQVVSLGENYVSGLLKCANIWENEIKVGKEDKYWTQKQIDTAVKKGELPVNHDVRVGDVRVKGIRTIWEEIHSSQVFTVCYQKADKKMSAKAYNETLENQRLTVLAEIEKAAKQKKGVANVAATLIEEMQRNPIIQVTPGEERVLRGFKKQFRSRDGKYDCMDMDINEIRPVNINTILWLVYDGVKYIVE